MRRLLMAAAFALAATATAATAATPVAKPGAAPASPVEKVAAQKCKTGWSYSKKAGRCVKNRYSAVPAPKVRVRRSA